MKADSLEIIGREVVEQATRLGAAEATARLSRSVWTEVASRDGRLEKSQESRSLELRVSLLVENRYSTHATNDLRPEAIGRFLQRAVEATRTLEPDPDRRLADRSEMGMNDPDALALVDFQTRPGPQSRREEVAAIEDACRSYAAKDPLRSAAAQVWDGRSSTCMVCSNGFVGAYAATSFGCAAELTMAHADGRLPEATAIYSARHHDALPRPEHVAAETLTRARRRLGSKPIRSGRYPVLVSNHRAGRLLGLLLTPITGPALYEGRSCFADALGRRLSPRGFTLYDDPSVPGGLGSRPFDADGLRGRRVPLFEDGVLGSFLLDVYHARRLGRSPTTGMASNIVIPPGRRAPLDLAADYPLVIQVEGFLGGNANPATGAYSLGVHGTLLEHGEPAQNVSEMNMSGSLSELLDRWVAAANDPWEYGAWRSPSLLFDSVQFSGS